MNKKQNQNKNCKNCLMYKQYYTIHNLNLVEEDRGICCYNNEITFVEDICDKYLEINQKNAINIEKINKLNSIKNKSV